MIDVKIDIDQQFFSTLKNTIEGTEFQTGVLDDFKHKKASVFGVHKIGIFQNFHGVGVKRKKGKVKGSSIKDIAKGLQWNFQWATKPFNNINNKEVIRLMKTFIRTYVKDGKPTSMDKKRLINLSQSIYRNPIVRKDYGANSNRAIKRKGFDHLLVDTGQFFDAIKSKIKKIKQFRDFGKK